MSSFKLTAKQIEANMERFTETLQQFGTRSANLQRLYDSIGERLYFEPASSYEHYHNAIPGGYIDHVLNVIDFSEQFYNTWVNCGLDCSNFTLEELKFAALNHDLGKLGFPGENNGQYQPNKSAWHVKNQGKIYEYNSEIPFMLVPDRSLFLLQMAQVPVTLNEYMGIKLHDGLYDDSNKAYYLASRTESKLRSHLPFILHEADKAASMFERERWEKKEDKFRSNMNFTLSSDKADGYMEQHITDTEPKQAVKPTVNNDMVEFDQMFNNLFS